MFVQVVDWLLNLNAPRHSRIRSLMARTFTARRIAGLEPAITAMADELLDAMAERGSDGSAIEFMHDFAYLLPVTVICELIGIPEADRERFRPLTRDLTGVFELSDMATLPAIDAAAVELLAYFTELAARRRAVPRDNLVSDLLAVTDADDGRLTDAELLHNLTLLLVASFETTTNLLGNGLQVTLQNPPIGEGVRDGSIPAPAFVEEVLRYDSPVQLTSRIGYDTTVGGVPVSPGAGVTTLLGAGNGIRAGSPPRTGSTRCVPTAGPSASAAARTSASAQRWPGSRAPSLSPGCSTGSRRSPPRANRPAWTGFSCAASTGSR